MGVRLTRRDIKDSDLIDADELASSSSSSYVSIPCVSCSSLNKRVVVDNSGRIGGLLTSEDPTEVGDVVIISGSTAANGTYTVSAIIDDSTFEVVEAIPDSLSGTAAFRYPAGSTKIGISTTGAKGVTTRTVQGFINEHGRLRELIHFIDTGPADGFSGAYREKVYTGNSPWPDSVIWWTDSGKTAKIVEKVFTSRNSAKQATTITWKIYDTDGSTVLLTVTDTITYSGVKEATRSRVIT